jgi:MazG family protein
MARLRSPSGCPWDREQDHHTLRYHAVEEVYELIDAIEANDDQEMREELGDLLLQVVFHCQLAGERGAFTFNDVAQNLVAKLVRRHPHVYGTSRVRTVDAVWKQWEQIKKAEKHGTHARPSALDGIPRHLPALLRAEKLLKKARKAGLQKWLPPPSSSRRLTRTGAARTLFEVVRVCQEKGWCAEDLLAAETKKVERRVRAKEAARGTRRTK